MEKLVIEILFWHWWAFGVLLVGIEILMPGFFFLWIGIAAMIVGMLLFFVPGTPLEIQLLIFAFFSVISVVGWRIYLRRYPIETDKPTLNRRGEQYVGRVFQLEQPIVNGRGKVRVGDTLWAFAGDDMPAGETVRVTGVEGAMLIGVKAENS